MTSKAQTAVRLVLGGVLVLVGAGHLTVARERFRAQVPVWVPVDVDDTVLIASVLWSTGVIGTR